MCAPPPTSGRDGFGSLAKLAGGVAPDELAQEYELAAADIRVALGYAATVLASAVARQTRTLGL